MKLIAQQLVERLEEIYGWFEEMCPKPDDINRMDAIEQAIKSVKTLQLIARSSWPHFDECDWQDHAEWCVDQAKAVFHE